jgi:hypothetical protein
VGFPKIIVAARRGNDYVDAARREYRQGVKYNLVVLVPPELVREIKKTRR